MWSALQELYGAENTSALTTKFSEEAFCTVDQPNPGEIQPSFSISGPVEGKKNATRFDKRTISESSSLYNKARRALLCTRVAKSFWKYVLI